MVVPDTCQELGSSAGTQAMLQQESGEHKIRTVHQWRGRMDGAGTGQCHSWQAHPIQQAGAFLAAFGVRWSELLGLSGMHHRSWCFKRGFVRKMGMDFLTGLVARGQQVKTIRKPVFKTPGDVQTPKKMGKPALQLFWRLVVRHQPAG